LCVAFRYEVDSFEQLAGADARKVILFLAVMAVHAVGEGGGVGVSFAGDRGWAQVSVAFRSNLSRVKGKAKMMIMIMMMCCALMCVFQGAAVCTGRLEPHSISAEMRRECAAAGSCVVHVQSVCLSACATAGHPCHSGHWAPQCA
jgi:hypothetical protein